MKWLIAILAAGFVLISACVIYLVKTGVSLRSAPYIKPTVIQDDIGIIAEHISLRLFPDFQSIDYWILEADPENKEWIENIQKLQGHYEKQFKRNITSLVDSDSLTSETVKACPSPCWIITGKNKAHSLQQKPHAATIIEGLGKDYRSLTWIYFNRHQVPSQKCVEEQRLTIGCLPIISVHELEKKMKDENKRYFLLRKYLDRDYFILVQNK